MVGGVSRGEPRGGGACSHRHRSSWGSVAGTESRTDGAAVVAGPQWYAACIGGQLRCERVLANAGCAWMMLHGMGWGSCTRGCSGWLGFRGASRGAAGACRQSHRRWWGSVAGTESLNYDAADVAGPLLYAACIGGSLRCERVLANAGCAKMMLRAVGWGRCARGCSGWWGFARGEPRGGGACSQ